MIDLDEVMGHPVLSQGVLDDPVHLSQGEQVPQGEDGLTGDDVDTPTNYTLDTRTWNGNHMDVEEHMERNPNAVPLRSISNPPPQWQQSPQMISQQQRDQDEQMMRMRSNLAVEPEPRQGELNPMARSKTGCGK